MDIDPGPEPVDPGAEPVDPGSGVVDSDGGSKDSPGRRGDGPEAGDAPDPTDDGKDPLRFNRWMKQSAAGAVMTGIAVGLQQALELPRQQPAFVIEAAGEPEDPDRPIDLKFDPDSPANTVAVIRRPRAGEPARPSPPPEADGQ